MTTTVREVLVGAGAAMVFIGLFLGGSMPWGLALLLAVAVYTGVRVLLPVVSAPHDVLLDGGVTQGQLQELVQGGRQQLGLLHALADRLKHQKPTLHADVMRLCTVAERILSRVEREPKSVHLAGLFPMYLETIVRNMQRYVTLTVEEPGGTTRPERLLTTEQMVSAALPAFEQIWERLSREDWLTLEAEAETLKTFFNADLG